MLLQSGNVVEFSSHLDAYRISYDASRYQTLGIKLQSSFHFLFYFTSDISRFDCCFAETKIK